MKCSRGVALISVLLIVALAAILVTKMTGKLMLQMQRTVNVNSNQQAYWYALGAEAFALSVLKKTFEAEPNVTHLAQYWAQGETSYPVDLGSITGQIFDLQACFNLNALRAPYKAPSGGANPSPSPSSAVKKTPARAGFEKLILALNIEGVDTFTAESLADALTDWLDENDLIESAGGAEDSDYSGKEYPYLAANHYLASVSELRVIEHFTPEIIAALKDYVCVIPNSSLHQINVNTVPEQASVLLQAFLDISASEASEIISSRGEQGFDDINQLWKLPILSGKSLTNGQKQQMVVDSEYFKLQTMASFNDSYLQLTSIIQIAKNNSPSVIARSIGTE